MIIGFYDAGLQLDLSNEEGKLLFPDGYEGRPYVRVEGLWKEGIRIFASDINEYINRPDIDARYYKPTLQKTSGRFIIISVGWTNFGKLDKQTINYPTRGVLDTKLVENQKWRYLQSEPFENINPSRTSASLFVTTKEVTKEPAEETVVEAKPQGPFVFPPIPEPPAIPLGFQRGERLQPEVTPAPVAAPEPTPVPTPEPVPAPAVTVAAPSEPTPAPVHVEPEPALSLSTKEWQAKYLPKVEPQDTKNLVDELSKEYPVPPTTTEKLVTELKNLALELNKMLVTLPDLHVTINNGLLSLEQDVIEYEEF